MPDYDYQCERCKAEFTVHLSMNEHTEKDRHHEIQCPKCKSTEVKHLIETVYIATSRKS